MKMVSGQPRLRPPKSWLWILLVATGAALKLAGALQLSGDSRFHRHLLQEPTCPFSSLRQLVDASEDGTGLFACSYCTLSGCTLSCQSCKQPGLELPAGPSSLDLSSCDTLSTLSMSDGQLVCEAPPPPLLLVGDIQVTISHANENDNSTAERIPPSLSYAIVINQTETELGIQIKFELGDLAQEADLMNGDKIELAVAPASGSRRRRMQEGNEASGCAPPFCISPDSIRNISKLAGASGKDFVVNNRPVNITSIIMLATMCNVQPLISEQTLRNALFKPNQNQPSPYANLQHYYDVCSYRKVMFTPENNKVTTVNLPCSAPYQGGVNYDTANLCGDPELYGWQRDALTQAVSKLAISNATYYKRRVLLMPERAACQWAGLASVGCDVNCNTWLQQYDRWFELTTAFHELGHNIGLQHANRWIDGRNSEYDDFTDPMGSAYTDWATDQYGNKSMVCLSAPEAFKAGWMSPVRKFALSPYPDNSTIRTDLLPPNSAQRVVIPSMHTTDNNFLWINVSSLPDFKPSWPAWAAALPRANQLFVSYRVKQPQPGFDSGLVPELSNKIFIHSFNITQRSPPRPDPSAPEMKPSLIGILDTRPGRVMGGAMTVDTFFRLNYGPTPFNDGTQPGSTGINGIHISVVSTSSSQAVVNVCYFRYARESDAEGGCDNGSDDDCDGLIDAADPDCAGAVRSPPPPPVRSPPPPPVRSPPPPPPVRSPPPPPVRSPPPPPPVRSPPPPPTRSPPPPPPTRSPPPPPPTRSPPPPPPTRSPPPPVRSPPPPPPVRSPRPPPPVRSPPPPPPIRSPPPPPPIRSPPPPPRARSPKLRRPPSPPKRRRPRTGRLQ